MSMVTISGRMLTREVFVDGKSLDIGPSRKVRDHSSEFCWGYGGSGPAQLALALALHFYEKEEAIRCYQDLKWGVIAKIKGDNSEFKLSFDPVLWMAKWGYSNPPFKSVLMEENHDREK